jgi:hypothetical protein
MSILNDIDNKKFIEETIEKKFNQILEKVPDLKKDISKEIAIENDFFNFSIIDTYRNTLQTIIDIINDITKIIDNSDNYNNYFKIFLNIFFNENRMFYIGIILIILSFVIYFIDGATI